MGHGVRATAFCATVLAVLAAGCSGGGGVGTPTARADGAGKRPAPLTGAGLSALIPTPAGFTFDPSQSSSSGARVATPVPGASSANGINCSAWWSGKGYFGPGTVGYAENVYTGLHQVILNLSVYLYPAGDGTAMFTMSSGELRRCHLFTYQDRDGQSYVVHAALRPSPGIGNATAEDNATETSTDGSRFTTQTTYVNVGDAMVMVNETGPVSAHVNRGVLPLAAIVAKLRAAGY